MMKKSLSKVLARMAKDGDAETVAEIIEEMIGPAETGEQEPVIPEVTVEEEQPEDAGTKNIIIDEDGLSGILERLDGLHRETHRIGIEGAAERRIGRKGDDGHLLPARSGLLPGGAALPGECSGERSLPSSHQPRHHLLQRALVGTHALDGLLRPAELGGGHEFHRGSDLQRALDGADAALYFLQ